MKGDQSLNLRFAEPTTIRADDRALLVDIKVVIRQRLAEQHHAVQ